MNDDIISTSTFLGMCFIRSDVLYWCSQLKVALLFGIYPNPKAIIIQHANFFQTPGLNYTARKVMTKNMV